MGNKTIPAKMNNLLTADKRFSVLINDALNIFESWQQSFNLKLFSEHTDHSLNHARDILLTSEKLINKKSWGILSPGDMSVFILATLLHDCAMHLDVDGFITLISSNHLIPGFNNKSWLELWEDFIGECRRYSGKKLMALFGDASQIKPPPYEPKQLHYHKLTGKDLILIGEFLRRNHHRIAHEIAVWGVPGANKKFVLPFHINKDTEYISDLAGVVARSHGLPIRHSFDYLKKKYSSFKSFKGVHTVFLMGLLRIADILQIHSERAPWQLFELKKFHSPISHSEWEMHQAIIDINWSEFPETIFIHAEPKNARTFLKIEELLKKIQKEIDDSWNALGEAYYYDPEMKKLGFSIRRICSNLDDRVAFAKRPDINYIPYKATFESADADLLKLLVKPLYGDRPEIGIRELTQNAVDAVLECQEYCKKHPELSDVEFLDQEAEIVISLSKEKDDWWLTVSDKGIGMTLDTVRNFFLKAGASILGSEEWKKEFVNENGKSQVLRSGHFGIGILAAFLLGNDLEVSTKFISESSKDGISLMVSLDSEMVELKYIERPVGTTIRIGISDRVKELLLGEWDLQKKDWINQKKWDWYCLRFPRVLRKVKLNNEEQILIQNIEIPSYSQKILPPGWYRIAHSDYYDLQWTQHLIPNLVVNGIKISGNSLILLWEEDFYRIKSPNISIFDKNAIFPINLNKSGITQIKYPFYEILLEDVIKDIIASCFVNAPLKGAEIDDLFDWCSRYNYNSFHFGLSSIWSPWFITNNGISFALDKWHINQADATSFVLLPSNIPFWIPEILSDFIYPNVSYAVFLNHFDEFDSYRHEYSKRDHMEELAEYINICLGLKYNLKTLDKLFLGRRVLISKHLIEVIDEISLWDNKQLLDLKIFKEYSKEWENENWILWQMGKTSTSAFDFKKLAMENEGRDYDQWPCIIAEWYLRDKNKRSKTDISPLAKIWREYVGSPIMPFDIEERKKLKGYKILKPYIEAHEYLKKYKIIFNKSD